MKKHILKTYKKIQERKWDRWYWAVDIHDTCIKANYSSTELPTEFFPNAKEALIQLSNRPDCCLILFTCSHRKEINQYLRLFEENGINFDYVNENPEIPNTELGNFDQKFYTNIYLDDKAGFDPEEDWVEIQEALHHIELLRSSKRMSNFLPDYKNETDALEDLEYFKQRLVWAKSPEAKKRHQMQISVLEECILAYNNAR